MNDRDGPPSGPPPVDDLNVAALHAIMGVRADREQPLIELLLSDRPVHPWVRSALAAALQGKAQFGCNLQFVNTTDEATRLQRQAKGAELRKTWVEIGDWIAAAQEKDGLGYKDAIEAAAIKFLVSEKKCEASYTYRNEFRKWLSANCIPGTVYGARDLEELSDEYHDKRACGRQMPRNRTIAEQRQEMLRIAAKFNMPISEAELTTLFADDAE